MKAGDDFTLTMTTESGDEFVLRANVRAIVPREDQLDLAVLGPMFVDTRPASFTLAVGGIEYEVIPT